MKNIIFIISCMCSVLLSSCKKEAALGEPATIEADYKLPQGDASPSANNRIKDLFDQYGSYFLYVFTQRDFDWTQATGSSNSQTDSVVLGNPIYTEEMLQFLDDIWLQFLPEEFKKGGGLPYRIFMAGQIKRRRPGTGYPPGMEYLFFDYRVTGLSITFAGMNESLRTMTPAEKVAKKNILQGVIWDYYLGRGIVTVPTSFYNVSSYVVAPLLPINASNMDNLEAYRSRGFLPGSYNSFNGAAFEWYNGSYAWSNARSNDVNSFMLHVIQKTDAEMAPYLEYPMIQEKFAILVKHFKDEYGIDVRAIANATF